MHNIGLYWAMYPPQYSQFVQYTLPAIMSGAVDDANRIGLPIQKHGNIAFITIKGAMVKGSSYWRGVASSYDATLAVESAIDDNDVENIILLMDSPGGSVDGLAELGDSVKKAASIKNVIAQIEGMSASANYYVASQANKIYSGRNDLIGSIGTRIMLMDSSKFYEDNGMKVIPIDTGEFKSAGAPGTKITENHIADFQRIVDGYYDDFLEMGASGRGVSVEEFKKAADGRVFLPNEALDLGLIDGIQTLKETIRQLTPAKSLRQTATAKRLLQISSFKR